MPKPPKTAIQTVEDLNQFINKVRNEVSKLDELKHRLETDEPFRNQWETDSAKALIQVGINPDARMEMEYPEYEKGPECNYCITPMGNACHC